jgi:hypothetical protein
MPKAKKKKPGSVAKKPAATAKKPKAGGPKKRKAQAEAGGPSQKYSRELGKKIIKARKKKKQEDADEFGKTVVVKVPQKHTIVPRGVGDSSSAAILGKVPINADYIFSQSLELLKLTFTHHFEQGRYLQFSNHWVSMAFHVVTRSPRTLLRSGERKIIYDFLYPIYQAHMRPFIDEASLPNKFGMNTPLIYMETDICQDVSNNIIQHFEKCLKDLVEFRIGMSRQVADINASGKYFIYMLLDY